VSKAVNRISAFDDLVVRSADGARLGRVHEIHATNGRITELVYGTKGLIERLTGKAEPTKVAWSSVARVARTGIVLKPGGT